APPIEKPKREPKKPKKRPSYEMKLFEKYELNDVVVHDAGLAKYMNLSPIVIPHTGGRWANKPFGKAKANLVERLINNMMRTENYTGKKSKSYRVVRTAFEIIEKRTQKNPVQVLVDALEKAAPREEVTRLRFGGISVPRAVDVAPSRRLDLALRSICQGTVSATFKNRKPVEECLADEILLAAKGDMQSSAIARVWVDGQWVRAVDLWNRFQGEPEVENRHEADVRNVVHASLWTRSIDIRTGDTSFAQITHVWRLKAREPLVEIETRDGRRIRTTPEHKFVTAAGHALRFREARGLDPGIMLAVPRRLPSRSDADGWTDIESQILDSL